MAKKTPFDLVPGEASELFAEEKIAPLVLEWQKTASEETFAEILEGCYRLVGYIVADYLGKGWRGEFENLCHECLPKLRRVLKRYDPSRGRLFSLLMKALRNHILYCFAREKTVERYVSFLDPRTLAETSGSVPPPHRIELEKVLAGYRTRFAEPDELRIQSFIIEYFLEKERFPTLPQINRALPDLGWHFYHYGILRNYTIFRLRCLFAPEHPSPAGPVSERDKQIEAILGPELYRKVAPLLAGMSFRLPGPEYFAMIEKIKRFLEEGGSERGFFLVYPLLRRGALDPAPLVPLPVVSANGNGNGESGR